MSAVMEIVDKSVIDSISSSIRIASPQIRFSPTCPAGVTNAVIYMRMTHRITMMEWKGSAYVVVTYSSQPSAVLHEIKTLVERRGGSCKVLHGVEANDIAYIASNVN